MKRLAKWIVLSLLAVLLVAIVAVVVLLRSAQPAVSLTLLEYKRWPHGAMLRLTNGTQATVKYRAGTGPPMYLVKSLDDKVREEDGTYTVRDLGPGKVVDFFVRLNADTAPVRVAVLCEFPQADQNSIELTVRLWLWRKLPWLGLKPPIQLRQEVWCPIALSVPSVESKPK